VVPTPDEPAEPADFPAMLPAAAEGTGAASAAPGAALTPVPAAAAELAALLALLPEHAARNPASMAPPIDRAAMPVRVRLAIADRRFKLNVFSMRV
jgi:hypothetical protein